MIAPDFSNNFSGILALVAAALYIYGRFQGNKAQKAESELQVAGAQKTDAVLAQKQADIQTQIEQTQKQGEDLKKSTPTLEELAKELNK